jgi:uncharacterized membrane protein YedE/YeeE
MDIVYAIILGTLFGFILQRVGAADPDKILGMLRLTDLHLAKTILTGIGIATAFLFLGLSLGIIDSGHLSVKSVYAGVAIGGLLFGVGWALSGFCPGTGVVAIGLGRKDAVSFVLGGLVGAGLFTLMYGGLMDTFLFQSAVGGKITFAQVPEYDALLSGLSGVLLAVPVGVGLILFAFFLPKTLRKQNGP